MADPFTDEDRARLEGMARAYGNPSPYAPALALVDAQAARAVLAHIDHLEARAKSYDKALAEAVSDLAYLEAALEAADELADSIVGPRPVRGSGWPLAEKLHDALDAYRSARASKGEEDG